jgi:hypothetical protein
MRASSGRGKTVGYKNPPFPFSGGVKKPRQKEPTLLDASGVDQKTRGKKTLSLLQLPQQKPFTLIRRCIV